MSGKIAYKTRRPRKGTHDEDRMARRADEGHSAGRRRWRSGGIFYRAPLALLVAINRELAEGADLLLLEPLLGALSVESMQARQRAHLVARADIFEADAA